MMSAFLLLACLAWLTESFPTQVCNTTEECDSLLRNSHCLYGECFCLRGYYHDPLDNGTCREVSKLGENCTSDSQCASKLQCFTGICACRTGYRQVEGHCEPRDFESLRQLLYERPNVLIVILTGLGTLALKLSLIYLLAKLLCFHRQPRTEEPAVLTEVTTQPSEKKDISSEI